MIEVKPGLMFGKGVLRDILPDVETALFFGKVYSLDAQQLGNLLAVVFKSDVIRAFTAEGGYHSMELQDYMVDLTMQIPQVTKGQLNFTTKKVPKGEILPELWKSLEIEVAASIKAVAEKLQSVVGLMPGKQGEMVFKSMNIMNRRRPTIGDYKASIHHAPQKQNLIIFDVSGSMSQRTVETIVDDVVALSYVANAHLAIVSNTCTSWDPGAYSSDVVLQHAEFGGTQYEQLVPLLEQDWGTVVCIADYDSSPSAKSRCASAGGHIDELLDISLVNRPTYLSECVGQLADRVRPLLVANSYHVLRD